MKKIQKTVKITSIFFTILFIGYFALHNAAILSLLKKVNLKYDACVDDVCFSLNDEWLVLYNSDSLYGIMISKIYGNNNESMSLVKMQGTDVVEKAMYSKSLKKIDLSKYGTRKNFDWGTVTVLSSETTDSGEESLMMYLDEYDIFITSTTEDALFDIR